MRNYELMLILDPEVEERSVGPSLEAFLSVVRNGGGTVEKVDVWGRRRLAYPIQKKTEGIYAVLDLSCEPATVQELDRQLGLNEAVLRTKVLRPEVKRGASRRAAESIAGASRRAAEATAAAAAAPRD